MKTHLLYLLILSLLLVYTKSDLPDNYTHASTATIIPNIHDLGYSHNQRLLLVIQQGLQGAFHVYDGIRISDSSLIKIQDQQKFTASPSTFAFNHNDTLLVIGTEEGSVFGYKVLNSTISESWSYNISFGSKDEVFTVRSISIDLNNNIVVAVKNNIYVLTLPEEVEGETAEFVKGPDFKFVHIVQSVCWSVLEPNVVVVGTLGELDGNFSFLYIDNKTQMQINTNKTLGVEISPDGKTIYKSTVENNIEVYEYQVGDVPKLVATIPQSNSSTKIRVSGNSKYLAAKVRGGRVKSWRIVTEVLANLKMEKLQHQKNLKLSFQQNLDQEGKNFALSQLANDLLIIPSADSSQVPRFTLCPNSTYLEPDQNDCLPCQQSCVTCFTPKTCISCTSDKFIDGDSCSKCNTKLNGCLTCESEQKCLTCDEGTNWNQEAQEGKCTCKDTFYDKDGQCKECGVFLDCVICSGEDYCTLCKNQNNFDTKPIDGKCQCKTSFWLNTTQCVECSKSIPDCNDCTQNGQQCKSCQSPDRKPSPDQSKCQCIDYRYEDETGICQLCDQYQICIECQPQSPHSCKKCDTSKNRKQTPQDGKCMCNDGFYDNQEGGCVECAKAIPDCDTCSDENNCLLCKNQGNFNPDPVGGKCVCLSGWILDLDICKLCSEEILGCKTCSSTFVCEICNEDLHFYKTPNLQGKCVCQSTYWFDGKLCQLCSNKVKGCDTCSNDGEKCLTCQDPNRKTNPDGKSCQCKEYFYEDSNQVCQLCDQNLSCLKCNQTDPLHKCILCDENKHWNATPFQGICKCMTGYNQYDGRCIFCQIPGCIECQTQSTCKECDPTKHFDPKPENDTCKCIGGTYKTEDKRECLNCSIFILGCKQCFNADDCELCDENQHFISNPTTNKCDCMKSYYLKNNQSCEECNSTINKCIDCLSAGTQVFCTACENGWGITKNKKSCVECGQLSVGCIDCSDSGHCLKCDGDAGFVLNNNSCVCKQGLYLKNRTCLECSHAIPGCNNCSSEASCTNCTDQNHFLPTPDQNEKCSCIKGWTLNEEECKACSVIMGCLECQDTKICTKCDDSLFFELTPQGTCECKQSYWLNVSSCQQCQTSIYDCQLCSQDGKQCETCQDPNRQPNQDKNLCECKRFTYESEDKTCQNCDEYKICAQCDSQGNHQCKVCDADQFWNSQPTVDGLCTCQKEYIEFNHSCVLCSVVGCSQCKQTNTCSICSTQKRFDEQPVEGQCKCQPQTILDTDKCLYCREKLTGCMTCSNFTQCIKCEEDQFFVLDEETKKCLCDSGHYLVAEVCKDCSEGIKYCEQCEITEERKQCNKCKKGFEPSEDQTSCLNCEDLIIGCADCVDKKTCQECDGPKNFVFNEDKTDCVCNVSYFLRNRECVNCSQSIVGCDDCNLDGTECNGCNQQEHFELNNQTKICTCIQGYFLKTGACLNCSTLLPGCLSCAKDGSKCLACQQGYFISDGQCSLCSFTIPGCTKCSKDGTECSECNSDRFILNNSTQKCDCIASFFLNITECSLCEEKFIGCNLCNFGECIECKPDHFVYNNVSNQCLCQDGYYLNATERKCKLCEGIITGCVKCSQDGQKCVLCDEMDNFVLDNSTNKCSCNKGFFLEQGRCALCSSKTPGCTLCSQLDNSCSQCNITGNFIFNSTTKLCSCKQSYYVSSRIKCTLCSEGISYCESCQSSPGNFTPQCGQCKEGFDLSSSHQSCTCPGSDKEIVDGQCVDKEKVNWLLYGAIGGGALLILGVGVAVYIKWNKARSRVSLEEEFEQTEIRDKRSKQETLLTSENNSNLLKSSGSLDIDE